MISLFPTRQFAKHKRYVMFHSCACLLLHGSWLVAHGSWLMAHGQESQERVEEDPSSSKRQVPHTEHQAKHIASYVAKWRSSGKHVPKFVTPKPTQCDPSSCRRPRQARRRILAFNKAFFQGAAVSCLALMARPAGNGRSTARPHEKDNVVCWSLAQRIPCEVYFLCCDCIVTRIRDRI